MRSPLPRPKVVLAGRILCLFFTIGVATAAPAQPLVAYSCFSLRAAQELLESGEIDQATGPRWLSGITRPIAVVVDTATADCILVGERDPSRPPLSLDDLAVALRAAKFYGAVESPGVSIDPLGDQQSSDRLLVRYFGGIYNTHFGKVCFESDYLLKQMDLGLVDIGSQEVESPWAQFVKKPPKQDQLSSVFSVLFFYPKAVRVTTDVDAAVLEICRIGVENASMGGPEIVTTDKDEQLRFDRFAAALSEHYDEISETHAVLKNLQSLMGLYALCRQVLALGARPDLSYWLYQYPVEVVATPRMIPPLRQGMGGLAVAYEISGSVELEGLAIRVIDGDASAFKQAVLFARPSPKALTWTLLVDEEIVSGAEEEAWCSDLFSEAVYHIRAKDYDRALPLLTLAIENGCASAEVYGTRALAYVGAGDPHAALSDCERGLARAPSSAFLWACKGRALEAKGDDQEAWGAYSSALELNPSLKMPAERQAFLQTGAQRDDGGLGRVEITSDSEYRTNGRSVWESWRKKLSSSIDPSEEIRARQELETLRRTGAMQEASDTRKSFPGRGILFDRPMLDVQLGFKVRLDEGNLFTRRVVLFGPDQLYTISFPLQAALVLKNRVRFFALIPYDILIMPFQIPSYFGSDYVVGMATGPRNPQYGMQQLLLSGLWDGPLLLVDLRYIGTCGKPLLEGYLSAETVEKIDGLVPFRISNPMGLGEVVFEQPVSSTFRLTGSSSFMRLMEDDFPTYMYYSGGFKYKFNTTFVFSSVGLALEYIRWRPQKHLRLRFEWETRKEENWNTIFVGVGSQGFDDSSSRNTYVFAGVDYGKPIFRIRHWF